MNNYFFHPEVLDRLYNCSNRTYEEWQDLGNPNLAVGIFFILVGVVYMAMYIPFIVVFIHSDMTRYSCYKIMFFLSFIDMITLTQSFSAGFFSLKGAVYCMYPNMSYIFGSFAIAGWTGGSTTVVLLAFNRVLDIIYPNIAHKLFDGRRTYFWLMIPTLYYLCNWFFSNPGVYNSNFYACFFDPFLATPERNGTPDNDKYPPYMYTYHCVVVSAVLFGLYSCLFGCVKLRMKLSQDPIRITKIQKQIMIQASIICVVDFIGCIIYVGIQFVQLPPMISMAGQLLWQTTHAAAPISYLLANVTMRNAAKKIFLPNKSSVQHQNTHNYFPKSSSTPSEPRDINGQNNSS